MSGKLFIVEYSITQNATHISTLPNLIRNNINNLSQGLPSDYAPVAVFESRVFADRFVIELYKELAPLAQAELGSRNWESIAEIVERLSLRDFSNTDSEPLQNNTTSADDEAGNKSSSKSDQ